MLEFVALLLAIALGGVSYIYWQLRQQTDTQIQHASVLQTDMAKQLEAKQAQLAQAQSTLNEQQMLLAQFKAARSDAESNIQIELNQAREALANQHTQFSSLQTMLTEREHEIAAFGQKLAEQARQYETQLEELQNTVKESQQTVTGMSETILRYQILANAGYDAVIVIDENAGVLALNAAAADLFNTQPSVSDSESPSSPSINGYGSLTASTSLQNYPRLIELTQAPALEMMVEDTLANAEEILEEQMNLNDRSFRVRIQVFREHGTTRLGLTLQDITQLIRLNRARRDMVANISHELRTPIANIRLIIDGLFHDQDKPKRKESISSLRTIARETDALLWLVQEMADLSMIESGQAIVRMVDVPLVEVINDATERLANQMAAKNLRVARHIPDKIRVLCDRDLIQRVVVNLLHNAMKWSPSDEVITVSAVMDDDEVVVSVFDNGSGVPDAQVDRIFERFYQVDASRSGHEGTGLGLAICKHIVVAHGGRIWAEGNTQGAGGRFKFTLLSTDNTTETPSYYANGTVSV